MLMRLEFSVYCLYGMSVASRHEAVSIPQIMDVPAFFLWIFRFLRMRSAMCQIDSGAPDRSMTLAVTCSAHQIMPPICPATDAVGRTRRPQIKAFSRKSL